MFVLFGTPETISRKKGFPADIGKSGLRIAGRPNISNKWFVTGVHLSASVRVYLATHITASIVVDRRRERPVSRTGVSGHPHWRHF